MKERTLLLEQQSTTRAEARDGAANPISPSLGVWERFTARLRAWFEVPFGYEDESGFHYGAQPALQPPRSAAEATSFRARVLTDRADHVMKHSVVLPVANAPAHPTIAKAKPKPELIQS